MTADKRCGEGEGVREDGADRLGAFMPGPRACLAGRPGGPLAALRLAVKDLFDVAGWPTTAGSPAWAASHAVPAATAPAVRRLMEAGASLVGKTVTDELAYSLTGANAHYGTPVNPAAPGRLCGGSSSGSASAVAGGLAEVALGTDTGGSVRLPASCCGILGFRPSHGSIPLDGVVPLAPSFDTVGWFARDASVLAAVGRALGVGDGVERPGRLLVAEDAFAVAGPAARGPLAAALARLEVLLGPAEPVVLAAEGLGAWRECFRICQAGEVWATHGAWVRATRPALGPGVAERFAAAARLGAEEIAAAREARAGIAARLVALLGRDRLLCLPSAPGPALRRDAAAAEQEAFRSRALELLSPAGLAGLPQISLPAGRLGGAPLGLSLVAPRHQDAMLLTLACDLEDDSC